MEHILKSQKKTTLYEIHIQPKVKKEHTTKSFRSMLFFTSTGHLSAPQGLPLFFNDAGLFRLRQAEQI